jgi:hypothetical protein
MLPGVALTVPVGVFFFLLDVFSSALFHRIYVVPSGQSPQMGGGVSCMTVIKAHNKTMLLAAFEPITGFSSNLLQTAAIGNHPTFIHVNTTSP